EVIAGIVASHQVAELGGQPAPLHEDSSREDSFLIRIACLQPSGKLHDAPRAPASMGRTSRPMQETCAPNLRPSNDKGASRTEVRGPSAAAVEQERGTRTRSRAACAVRATGDEPR